MLKNDFGYISVPLYFVHDISLIIFKWCQFLAAWKWLLTESLRQFQAVEERTSFESVNSDDSEMWTIPVFISVITK